MKRSSEVIQKILELLEASDEYIFNKRQIKIDGLTDQVIQGHIAMMVDKGMLFSPDRLINCVAISWSGYDALYRLKRGEPSEFDLLDI